MKTKRIIAGALSTVLCLSLLTECGESTQNSGTSTASVTEQSTVSAKTTHTLYIMDSGKSAEMTATFWNSTSGKSEDVKMEKTEEKDDSFIYSCEGDVNQYNMVHLTYGGQPTMDVAFNDFTSGWYLKDDELLPYVAGKEPKYDPKFEVKVFQFDGYDKNVYIWTPDDYDKDSADKYSVIYMMDGQSVLSKEIAHDIQCWNVAEHVESMMSATDNKAMIVAIETLGAKDEDGKQIGSWTGVFTKEFTM